MNNRLQEIPYLDKLKTKARKIYKNKRVADAIALRLYWKRRKEQTGGIKK